MVVHKKLVIILLFSSILTIDAFHNPFSCLLSPNFFQCLFNPCLKQTCSSFSINCISNYCGGCYFSLLDESNSPKANNLGPIKETSPLHSKDYGRFKKPLADIDFSRVSPALCDYVTRKHWTLFSITTSNYLIVSTIVNFNYVANAFAYIYDRNTQQFYSYSTRSLLAGYIKEKGKSSISGCTVYRRSSSEYLRHCYNSQTNKYEITVKVPMNNNIPVELNFQVDYSSANDPSMVLLYPVELDRPAYTHKKAISPVQGSMKIGNSIQENSLTGLSSMDWTLSYPKRVTQWKWVSLSTQARDSSTNESVTLGINLSDGIYNDKNDISMENAIWINGEVYTIDNRVTITSPPGQLQTSQPWQITTVDSNPKLNLTVQPKGNYNEKENLVVVVIDFVQIYGIFNGIIELPGRTFVIENSIGIVENHYAKW